MDSDISARITYKNKKLYGKPTVEAENDRRRLLLYTTNNFNKTCHEYKSTHRYTSMIEE